MKKKKRKRQKQEGIERLNRGRIIFEQNENSRYLGILETDAIKQMFKKSKKRVYQKNRKTSQYPSLKQK